MLKDFSLKAIAGVAAFGGAIGVGILLLQKRRKENNHAGLKLPPGPEGDASDEISEEFHLDFTRLGEKYGDIFSFMYGDRLVVVLNSYGLMKDAFLKRANDFSDRPDDFDDVMALKDELFSPLYTAVCRADKKMCSAGLRKAGMGAATPEGVASMQEEIDLLIKRLTQQQGTSFMIEEYIYKTLTNVLAKAMFGKSFEFDSPELKSIIDMICDWTRYTYDEGVILTCMPCKAGFKKFGDVWLPGIKRASAPWRSYVSDRVEEHKKTFDPNNIRDFIDYYINEKGLDWQPEAMVGTPLILTPDATDTLSIGIMYSFLYIIHHPNVQQKIHQEIDDVIGRARKPLPDDRAKMSYLEAVILETYRLQPVFGTSFPHATPKDRVINFAGYQLPKNSYVFANIYGIHRDARLFPDPMAFKPERFIDDQGNLIDKDKVVHFSVGKRVCMGEQFARLEHFLLLANVFQHFSLKFPDDSLPSLDRVPGGMANKCANFSVIAASR